jgi:hypothetical protein
MLPTMRWRVMRTFTSAAHECARRKPPRHRHCQALADKGIDDIETAGTGMGNRAACLLIMEDMGIKKRRDRKGYAAHRMCRAIDRLVNATSSSGKERAVRWINAWSTAYMARMERRRAGAHGSRPGGVERRRRNRYEK